MVSQQATGAIEGARAQLVAELRAHALVIGEVTLTSGARASYYVDAKRAILRPEGFQALAMLVAAKADEWEATAVGGMTMGADPVACAALAGGAQAKAFFVRKETKTHGLQQQIEGAFRKERRTGVIDDTITTGGSTLTARGFLRAAGAAVSAAFALVDRGEGAGEAFAKEGLTYSWLFTAKEVRRAARG